MSTTASPREAQGPPEAAGPGIDQPDGRVIFGHNITQRVSHEHLRSAEERERDRAEYARNARCAACADVPADVLLAIRTALRAAREGRPQR